MAAPKSKLNIGGSEAYMKRRGEKMDELERTGTPAALKERQEMVREDFGLMDLKTGEFGESSMSKINAEKKRRRPKAFATPSAQDAGDAIAGRE